MVIIQRRLLRTFSYLFEHIEILLTELPPPVVSLVNLGAAVAHDLVPGPDGQEDGVGPEQQDEDDDDDVGGGEVWLGDPPLVQRGKHCRLVVHLRLGERDR